MDHSDYEAIMLRLEPWVIKRDGPTIAEWVAIGYPASAYPPDGYESRSTPVEIAAAVAADEAAKKDGTFKGSDDVKWPPGEPGERGGEFDHRNDGIAAEFDQASADEHAADEAKAKAKADEEAAKFKQT